MIDAGENAQNNQEHVKEQKTKGKRSTKKDPLKALVSERELLTALLEKEGISYEQWLKDMHDEAIKQRYLTISNIVKEA